MFKPSPLPQPRLDEERAASPQRRPPLRRRRHLLLPSIALLSCALAPLLLSGLLTQLAGRSARLPLRKLEGSEGSAQPAPHQHPGGFSVVALLLGSSECNTGFDSIWAVVVHFLLILYTFIGLAIVCDEYFVESLELISGALKLSDDVAGATFMAAGSSAPELFTAIITIFVKPGEEGLGTVRVLKQRTIRAP